MQTADGSSPKPSAGAASVASPFTHQRRVEFADTDAAGIAHFSSLLRYCEEAEHAFLRTLGMSVHMPCPEVGEGVIVSWPRKRVSAEFHAPARFEEVLAITVTVAKLSRATLTYQFRLAVGSRHVADAETLAVCCQVSPGPLRAISIPEAILSRLPAPQDSGS